jgi:hypothetical protein
MPRSVLELAARPVVLLETLWWLSPVVLVRGHISYGPPEARRATGVGGG